MNAAIDQLVDETTLQDLDFAPPCELDGRTRCEVSTRMSTRMQHATRHPSITRSARIRGTNASLTDYAITCGKPTDRTHDRVTETPRTRNRGVTPNRTNNTRIRLLVEQVVPLPSVRARDTIGATR